MDRIFRETGCHIHVLTPSWLTNGLLLSQARVTARARPRRVVFPENRLKRIRVYTRYSFRVYRKFSLARNVSDDSALKRTQCGRNFNLLIFSLSLSLCRLEYPSRTQSILIARFFRGVATSLAKRLFHSLFLNRVARRVS